MRGRRVVAVALGAGVLALAAPGTAQAHPLGNFTVNHADHLQFSPDRVDLTAVLDRAEIPTAQALQSIAPDGTPTAQQLDAAATTECAALTAAVRVQVDGADVRWESDGAQLESIPGAAGLPTLRLTCTAHGDAALDGPASVSVSDDYLADRVGWREMTADGDGVRLVDSPVPVESSTDQLRSYPVDLLASPLDVRSFSVATEPGTNTGGAASVSTASGDPFSNAVAALDRRLEDLIGDRELTPLVGTLAVLLAVLLGCGHALLPGHGKTVMAAYLAGRDGRPRDAVTVGATVTATHTAGVLALGLAISASSSLAGDQVIRWLGVVSGLLVAGIGVAMLRGAVPRWLAGHGSAASPPAVQEPALAAATAHPAVVHGSAGGGVATAPVVDHPHERPFPRKGPRDHDHDHPHERPLSRKGPWDHDHPHPHPHPHPHDHDHDHPHGDRGHDHGDHEHHSHDHAHHDHAHHDHAHHDHDHGHGHGGWWSGGHSHGPGGHTHGPGTATLGRGGLVGMGIAGGLVPSPSALIVLLGSIGLGRTVFGVLLVLAYGLGMAGTLTAVGLLLVRLRGRLQQRAEAWGRRGLLPRLARALPVLTASLVLLVGLTLAVRGVLLG